VAGKPTQVSPLAPAAFPALPAVDGVRFAAAEAGVRYKGRLDVMLAEIAPGAAIAGVFTRSATRAGPVLWCEEKLEALQMAAERPAGGFAILVNAGNANAFTGSNGRAAVEATVAATAGALGVPPDHVFVASTGVVGEPL
jgi:glutamate N-acetyltransferase / amino-acid N-acetyltransferase